jgi:hypothetical protein
MSAIAKLTERLDAFAAKVETLEAEVKTLRSMTPLEAFTAGLKDASPEAIIEWMNLCQEMASALVPEAAPAAAPKTKGKEKKPRPVTNVTGPKEWNVFVQATWHSMAAEKGVLYEDCEGEGDAKDKAFKKAAAAEGITYQAAMKEASRRKALAEGKDAAPKPPKTELAKLKAQVAAKAAAPVAAKTPVAAKAAAASVGGGGSAAAAAPALATVEETEEEAEAEVEETEEEAEEKRMHKECLEAGWTPIQHKGKLHYKDEECGEVYRFPSMECVGIFNGDTFEPYV